MHGNVASHPVECHLQSEDHVGTPLLSMGRQATGPLGGGTPNNP